MKRNTLLFIMIVAFSLLSSHTISGYFGMGANTVSGYSERTDTGFSLSGALSYSFIPINPLFIEPGIRYITRTHAFPGRDPITNIRNRTFEDLRYLDLFVKAKYNIDIGQHYLRPFVGAAPSILLKATSHHLLNNPNVSDFKTNNKDYYNGTDFLLLLGIDFVLFKEGFSFGFEFNRGLTNIVKDGHDDFAVKNTTYMFNLGIVIPINTFRGM